MKQKKIPVRMCVVTHEKYEKKELLRVVKTKDDKIIVDTTGKINGKGAYIKKDIDVLDKAKKSKILDRTLGVPVSEEIYLEIAKYM